MEGTTACLSGTESLRTPSILSGGRLRLERGTHVANGNTEEGDTGVDYLVTFRLVDDAETLTTPPWWAIITAVRKRSRLSKQPDTQLRRIILSRGQFSDGTQSIRMDEWLRIRCIIFFDPVTNVLYIIHWNRDVFNIINEKAACEYHEFPCINWGLSKISFIRKMNKENMYLFMLPIHIFKLPLMYPNESILKVYSIYLIKQLHVHNYLSLIEYVYILYSTLLVLAPLGIVI